MLIAAARLNIPSVFVSGGAMLAGVHNGKKIGLSDVFEAVGKHQTGEMGDAELAEIENTACPTCGSCSGMYTANTMNCLTEALGMGLPGNGTIPAVYSERLRLAKLAGMQAVEVLKANLRPKDIMTREAFENAVALDMALGGSSNTALHCQLSLTKQVYHCPWTTLIALHKTHLNCPNFLHLVNTSLKTCMLPAAYLLC